MFDGPVKVRGSFVHALAPVAMAWLLLAAPEVTSSQPKLTATKVHRLIDTIGARGTIRKLFDSSDFENALVDGVATGGAGWLHVAERLRPMADGAAGELLSLALQEALPKNPSGVLAIIHRGTFSTIHACGGYGFGQYDDERPLRVLLRLIDRRVRAVGAVQDSHLASEQRSCIDELGKLRSAVEGQFPK